MAAAVFGGARAAPGSQSGNRDLLGDLGSLAWDQPRAACRLFDVARALGAIHDAVTAGTDPSRMRGTDAAALDCGRPHRA
ncbi:hypothetical protein [Streptomyces swartbergensis]|uniref:hypothetical protein n=1 Tax=Streptomyces swartbergensis TaxID=487165 RepID=UPI00117D8025|nr:hypothetical protein [Streptomyces swartbergensis]